MFLTQVDVIVLIHRWASSIPFILWNLRPCIYSIYNYLLLPLVDDIHFLLSFLAYLFLFYWNLASQVPVYYAQSVSFSSLLLKLTLGIIGDNCLYQIELSFCISLERAMYLYIAQNGIIFLCCQFVFGNLGICNSLVPSLIRSADQNFHGLCFSTLGFS